MRRDIIRLARPLQHKQLRQYRHGFQPYRKRPQHFRRGVGVREEDAEGGGAAEEVLDFQGVERGVVGGFVVVDHEVEDVGLGGEEEEFEDWVVDLARGEGPEDVF